MSEGITRRQVLALGAAGAGALAVGATGLVVSGLSSQVGTPESGPVPGPGGGAWAEPAVLTSQNGLLELDLRVAEANVLIGGSAVRMLSYNGTVPGPTLHLRPGDRLRVWL
ncbi:MAG: twin-arginine translocation signal domain-containing protein, partial [Microcella pacifica]